MIRRVLVIQIKALGAFSAKPHRYLILIFREFFMDHRSAVGFIVSPGKLQPLDRPVLGLRKRQRLDAGLIVFPEPVIIPVLSEGVLHNLHSLGKGIGSLMEFSVYIIICSQSGKRRAEMLILYSLLLEQPDGLAGLPVRLLHFPQLNQGSRQISPGNSLLIALSPLYDDGNGSVQGLLRRGKIPLFLEEQRLVIIKACKQKGIRFENLLVQLLYPVVESNGILQPSRHPVGGRYV